MMYVRHRQTSSPIGARIFLSMLITEDGRSPPSLCGLVTLNSGRASHRGKTNTAFAQPPTVWGSDWSPQQRFQLCCPAVVGLMQPRHHPEDKAKVHCFHTSISLKLAFSKFTTALLLLDTLWLQEVITEVSLHRKRAAAVALRGNAGAGNQWTGKDLQ